MTTKIYALTDNDGRIRYIGKTSKNVRLRFLKHLKDVRMGQKNHRCNWIRSLLAQGITPSIIEIGETNGDGRREEIAWIKYFRDEGVDLVNTTVGGDGVLGYKITDTARKNLSQAMINHFKNHPETKIKMSLAKKGKSPWCKGVKLSLDTCRKMGESRRLYYSTHEVSLEARRKTGMAHVGNKNMLGHHHTPATKQKMRDAVKNNPVRMEQIRNLGLTSRKKNKE